MPLTLNEIPGFADIPNAVMDAEDYVLGLHLARVSMNAAFGMVRLEVFTNVYKHGQNVPTPVSKVDGYQYTREECMYFWTPQNSADPNLGYSSHMAPWTMWYGVWKVDQATGDVESIIGYRGNDDHKDRQAQTNDGWVQVWTIAQRQKTNLTLAAEPLFNDIPDSDIYVDKPLKTTFAKYLNGNAKFGCVNTEVFYMGEFSHGSHVGTPVSPADGYVYQRRECIMMHAWRWTGEGTSSPVVPAIDKGQLQNFSCTVSGSDGLVSLDISYDLNGNHDYNEGKVAVFAFCGRDFNFEEGFVDSTAIPWRCDGGRNASYYYEAGGGINGYPSNTYVEAPFISGIKMIPGQKVTITYLSELKMNPSTAGHLPISIFWYADADGTNWNGGHTAVLDGPPHNTGMAGGIPENLWWPDQYLPQEYGAGALIGCFTDAAGELVAAPFYVGNGTVTKTVPASAVHLQLGINDKLYWDNFDAGFFVPGSYKVKITQTIPPRTVGTGFTEIPTDTFFPGKSLRASTVNLMNQNAREAMATPEPFSPEDKSNGDTVALPSSNIDSYSYGRDELTYIWTWASCGAGTDRVDLFAGYVNPTTGAVSIDVYSLPSGADSESHVHNGSMHVLRFAHRERENDLPDPTPVTPTGGVSSTPSGGGLVTVEGVTIGTME